MASSNQLNDFQTHADVNKTRVLPTSHFIEIYLFCNGYGW